MNRPLKVLDFEKIKKKKWFKTKLILTNTKYKSKIKKKKFDRFLFVSWNMSNWAFDSKNQFYARLYCIKRHLYVIRIDSNTDTKILINFKLLLIRVDSTILIIYAFYARSVVLLAVKVVYNSYLSSTLLDVYVHRTYMYIWFKRVWL